MSVKDWFNLSVLVFLCLFYFYLLSTPINLATADLGRHIRNGEQLLAGNFDLLFKNYYSYTNPDFPFINHHWLGGVVFYLVWGLSGFSGVQVLFITVNLITFCLFFYIANKYSNIYVSSLLALLIIPIIAYRTEVRPEVFSYLFAGVYYLVLKGFTEGKISKKWLFNLIPIQLIWSNTHIYFFMGFFIIGVFWLDNLIQWLYKRGIKEWKYFITISIVLVMNLLVSLLNPHFLTGLFAPFNIFQNYGYRVLENQSIFFLEGVINVPVLIYFKIILVILTLSWFYKFLRLFQRKENIDVANLIFSLAFSLLAIFQIRNLAMFGFFILVIIAVNLKTTRLEANKYLLVPVLAITFIFLLVINPGYWEAKVFGIGLAPGVERGTEFFKKANLKGPIFNNYDVGGYLIFELPKERVFVDNRPEGYPAEFFTEVYVPMQEGDEIWKQKLAEYNFNSIFFYRQDLTPWAQKFLFSRIKDPEWAPVFVDDYNIIFLKKNKENEELIKKYELPKEIFKTT